METFINGLCAISPQNTHVGEELLSEAKEYEKIRYLKCVEPNYSDFIHPMTARRMSRIIKMGTYSALKCISNAGIKNPDAIITATGLGCIEDSEKFLSSLFNNGEKLLNPTPFIQSTHNSVGAAIALMLKCYNYNNTFVHRSFSFENALLDGMMLLNEGLMQNILVGGIDELTPSSFLITDRLNFWKREPVNNLRLLEYKTKGSLAGEGAAFFLLSDRRTENSKAKLISILTVYKPVDSSEIENKVSTFIQKNIADSDKIDLVMMGLNGDPSSDKIYYYLKDTCFRNIPCTFFKHLCGEYDTSSSFALYLASTILKEQNVPDSIRLDNKPLEKIRNVLIYNHLRNTNHSAVLLSSC